MMASQNELPIPPGKSTSPPIALTIAGSDSSGGAGIQADLKTFTVLGVYGASVVTALTAQNTEGVFAVEHVAADFVRAQFDAVMSDLSVGAIKTGMLGSHSIIESIAKSIEQTKTRRNKPIPLIVDPVMIATSGDRLIDEDATDGLKHHLFPLASLITPNLAEAAVLLDCAPATSLEDMENQARALLKLGCDAVLLKGGHLPLAGGTDGGRRAVDVLWDGAGQMVGDMPWVDTPNTHGTGCTLSAAICAALAAGASLRAAVSEAKRFVWQALQHGQMIDIGRGNGPLNHLHAWK